ncbi:TraB/GumN family protein [Sphingomonas sp. LY160]|uniref:TraB/GumN family protein n=1 Tax=Sphingomonas sp. LY160 TaxID=3095342 RepID=UPI002ADEDF3C|nr:TraB/GumN family protein [Sphingomonas sp. LY160]MEA1071495.1 TraB/GumN family protein [Sphingomonas sp. LY160]
MKKFTRRIAAALLGLTSFSSMANAQAAPADAKPAMWRVADADTTIYLFGTIHLLPEGTKWRSAAFDKAAAGADTLVIETDIDDKNPQATIAELFKLAISPGLPPLSERVKPERKAALEKAVAAAGIPIAALDKMETWAAAFLLLGGQFKDLGLQPGSGVESDLKKQFTSSGKTIGQLETNAEQLGYFDRLSEKSQREFLDGMLENPGDMKKQFGSMLATWARGDVAGMAKSFNDELDESPELRDALLTQRNANWTKWVKTRLDQPGTVMVAVGAGHLAGDQSVVAMLEKQGLKVARVQ